jgi:aspartate aminotransferase
MFDQMYWQLTYGSIKHYNPVLLHPEMRPYTIFIDAVSKVFAATGVRVGWSLGPAEILNKMKAILSHVGAWAPMAEQKALAKYLPQTEAIQAYLVHFKSEVEERLRRIYDGLMQMKAAGLPVDAVAPEAAIYLTIKIELAGRKTKEGHTLSNQAEVTSYILKEAGLAVVPFHAFGASRNTPWYRLSVGTCHKEEINNMLQKLEQALRQTT